MSSLVSRRQALLATSALVLAPAMGYAQDWPGARPIKAVIPFGAGSSTDIALECIRNGVPMSIGFISGKRICSEIRDAV